MTATSPVPHIYARIKTGSPEHVVGCISYEIALEDGTSFRLPAPSRFLNVSKMEAGDFVLIDLRNWRGTSKTAMVFVYRQNADSIEMVPCTAFSIDETYVLISPALEQFGLL